MSPSPIYRDEHFGVDYQSQKAYLDGRLLNLTRKEYELLATLTSNAGETVPRNLILTQVWQYHPAARTRTLDVHIRRIRQKLAPYGDQYIETVFGIGYRFQPFRLVRQLYTHRHVA
jgi:two-component system phosphate regulon response regulator PhoB